MTSLSKGAVKVKHQHVAQYNANRGRRVEVSLGDRLMLEVAGVAEPLLKIEI